MRHLHLISICCLTSIGCAVAGVHNDHEKIRIALLDLYTNQIMDNLIRTFNGLPIVELDYTNAVAKLTVHETLGASDSPFTNTHTNVAMIAATTTLTATKTVANTIGGSLSADRSNQVQVTANPVNSSPQAYEAYCEFIRIPGSFRVTCNPPPAGAAHLCRQCGKKYYWVPVEFKKEFLALSLAAVTDRSSTIPAPDPFYTVSLLGIISEDTLQRRFTLKIDKPIPNDVGMLEITSGGKPTRFRISEYESPDGRRLSQTNRIVVTDNEKGGLPQEFPATAKVYLASHRPLQPAVGIDLKPIEFQLQQIQLNQIRNNP